MEMETLLMVNTSKGNMLETRSSFWSLHPFPLSILLPGSVGKRERGRGVTREKGGQREYLL